MTDERLVWLLDLQSRPVPRTFGGGPGIAVAKMYHLAKPDAAETLCERNTAAFQVAPRGVWEPLCRTCEERAQHGHLPFR